MKQKTWYKTNDEGKTRSMVANDVDGAAAALKKDGWVDKAPKGFKEPVVLVQSDIDALTTQVEQLNELNAVLLAENKKLKAKKPAK